MIWLGKKHVELWISLCAQLTVVVELDTRSNQQAPMQESGISLAKKQSEERKIKDPVPVGHKILFISIVISLQLVERCNQSHFARLLRSSIFDCSTWERLVDRSSHKIQNHIIIRTHPIEPRFPTIISSEQKKNPGTFLRSSQREGVLACVRTCVRTSSGLVCPFYLIAVVGWSQSMGSGNAFWAQLLCVAKSLGLVSNNPRSLLDCWRS